MRDNKDELRDKNNAPAEPNDPAKELPQNAPQGEEQQLSLNDDRRVKVLSPGAMVAKRFFRNRLAVVGLTMLIAMFLFSFLGGIISPYGQDQQFYTYEYQNKEYVGVVRNNDFRYAAFEGKEFGSILQAQFLRANTQKKDSFNYKDVDYEITTEGEDLYLITSGGEQVAIVYKDIVNNADDTAGALSTTLRYEALKAYVNGQTSLTADGTDYALDEDGNILQGIEVVGYISRFVVQSKENGVAITMESIGGCARESSSSSASSPRKRSKRQERRRSPSSTRNAICTRLSP